jgi:hypothetical protein
VTNERPVAEPTGAFRSVFDLSPRGRRRAGWALVFSIYYHALIMSLQFGDNELGILGFTIPYPQKLVQRRPEKAEVVEVPRAPAVDAASAPVSRDSPATTTAKRPEPVTATRRTLSVELRYVQPAPAAAPPSELSAPRRETLARAPAAQSRARDRKVRPKPRPPLLALRKPQEDTFKVPRPKIAEPEQQRAPEAVAKRQSEDTPPSVQTDQPDRSPPEALARAQSEDAARERAEEEARQRTLAMQKDLEAKKQAEARRVEELKKQDDARRQALELEARKLAEEKARQETDAKRLDEARKEDDAKKQAELRKQEDAKQAELKKQEEARQAELRKQEEANKQAELKRQEEAKQAELKKQEEARRLALELDTLKRAEELARQQAIARKALEAKRQGEEAAAREREAAAERARADAEAAARARDGLAKQQGPGQAPGAVPGKALASQIIDQLRAGRVDPSRPPSPAPGVDNPRRRAVIGIERDVMLRMYVESWRWKIERGGAVNYRPSAAWRASENPIVTVSIRSDGSLEDVFIHRSSGVRELDDAVRRIARLHAPYSAFPPALARQYDVIDIRRVWSFENALKILDEM